MLLVFRFYRQRKSLLALVPVSIVNYKLQSVYCSIIEKKMNSKIKNSKEKSSSLNKRPSIELAPSMERPVYIITNNLNGSHIVALTQELDRSQIAYQMQQQTATLGYKFNQRFFVIVDNRMGEVILGPQFGSILMTIVGYPRIGKNRKNRYFDNPKEIVKFYEQFKNDKDISDRQKTLINSQYSDIIMQTNSSPKINSKVVVRSISKYKLEAKEEGVSSNSSRQNLIKQHKKIKLLIVEDQSDEPYTSICDYLQQTANDKRVMERLSINSVEKKSMFHTKDVDIYYLTNQKYKRQLIATIAIGEVIVYSRKQEISAFKSIMQEEKIYAICSSRGQIIKILDKIGALKPRSKEIISNLSRQREESTIVPSVSPLPQDIIIKTKETVPQQESLSIPDPNRQTFVNELSKISALDSLPSQQNQNSKLDVSIISQTSYTSKKVKRLKNRVKVQQNPKLQSQYFPNKKQNQPPIQASQKRILKTEQRSYAPSLKSKKSLKFFDQVQNVPRVRRVKSITKCQPETVSIVSHPQHMSTMTDEYFPQEPSKAPSKAERPRKSSELTFTNPSYFFDNSSVEPSQMQKDNTIHAIFYRQFIPLFHNVIQMVKMNHSSFFNGSLQVYQPFFNCKQFDRSARKIKLKLRSKNKQIQEFNFVVFMLEEQFDVFQQYCEMKNASYTEELSDFQCTFRTTSSNTLNPKINIYAFSQLRTTSHSTIDFGRIKLIKAPFPLGVQLESKMAGDLRQKVSAMMKC